MLLEENNTKRSDITPGCVQRRARSANDLMSNFDQDEEMFFRRRSSFESMLGLPRPYVAGEEAEAENLQCLVCFESFSVETSVCTRCHANVCRSCFAIWLEVKIQCNSDTVIRCFDCREKIADDVIQNSVGPLLFRRLMYNRSKEEHRNNRNACWCPNEDCRRYIAEDYEDLPLEGSITCKDCNVHICGTCFLPDHGSLPCTVPRLQVTSTVKTGLWKKLHTRKCPACLVRIQRTGGCAHMHCVLCDTDFCWRCRSVLREGNNSRTTLDIQTCTCGKSRMAHAARITALIALAPIGLPILAVAGPAALLAYATLPKHKRDRVRWRLYYLYRSGHHYNAY